MLAAEAVFLIGAHYIKAYSDPSLWLTLADNWLHGQPIGPWAPLYPIFLGCCLKWLGRVYIFWVNTPFVLGLSGLIYFFTLRSLPVEKEASRTALAGVLAVVLFVVFNRWNLLELQNPYREAPAFCLLLSGLLLLLSFFRCGGLWRPALCAILIGLATGVRETCGLILIPAVLIFFWRGSGSQSIPRMRGLAVFLGTLVLGLMPFLVHNAFSTGRFWIPSYAFAKWTWIFSSHSTGFDIPIPGMSFESFVPIGRELLFFLLGKYTWFGAALFGLGLFSAIRSRNRAVLALLLPSVLVNLLFYSCWHTVSWRLALIVDLFAIPVMASGGATLFFLLTRLLARRRPGWESRLPRLAAWALAGLVAVSLIRDSAANRERMKVWQVRDLQRFVLPQLKAPAAFTEPGHAAVMFCWLLDLPYIDLQAVPSRQTGLDDTLAAMGARNLSQTRTNNIYGYGSKPSPLLAQWFDVEPGPSLKDAPIPIETYGRPLTEGLFRIAPWRNREINHSLRIARPEEDLLLMVDCLRLRDHPGRSFCHVYAGSAELPGTPSNGPSFFPVDRALIRNGNLDVRIVSDGPLPALAHFETYARNQEMRFPFGFRTNGWFYPLVPSGFFSAFSGQPDGFLLFRKGEMRLPKFCDDSREVLAEFRWATGRDAVMPGRVVLTGRHDGMEAAWAGQDRGGRAVLSLGRGNGGLEWEPVQWELPASNTWIRVLDVRLFPVPYHPIPALTLDVGSAGDEEFLVEGFFSRETRGSLRTARWSTARSRIRLPVSKPATSLALTVRCFPARPPRYPPSPRFRINNRPIPEGQVRVTVESEMTVYRFEVPAALLNDRTSQMLEMTCDPWIPSHTGGVRDSRPLGLMVDAIEASPMLRQ